MYHTNVLMLMLIGFRLSVSSHTHTQHSDHHAAHIRPCDCVAVCLLSDFAVAVRIPGQRCAYNLPMMCGFLLYVAVYCLCVCVFQSGFAEGSVVLVISGCILSTLFVYCWLGTQLIVKVGKPYLCAKLIAQICSSHRAPANIIHTSLCLVSLSWSHRATNWTRPSTAHCRGTRSRPPSDGSSSSC